MSANKMLQEITLADVFKAGRKAYEEKRLQAQNGGAAACSYLDKKGCPCVVGATMTAKTLNALVAGGRNGMGIGDLNRRLIIHIPPVDLPAITRLQQAHDNWSWSAATNDEDQTAELEAEFREYLYGED